MLYKMERIFSKGFFMGKELGKRGIVVIFIVIILAYILAIGRWY